jgi:hypothetical protein
MAEIELHTLEAIWSFWFLGMISDPDCMSSYTNKSNKSKGVNMWKQHWQFAKVFLSPMEDRQTPERKNNQNG